LIVQYVTSQEKNFTTLQLAKFLGGDSKDKKPAMKYQGLKK
jgi:hypothetical protein